MPYLLPKDGLPGQPEHSALSLDDLEAALREAVSKHARGAQMVLILDACFSGRAESAVAGQVAGKVLSPESSAGGVVQFAKRPDSEELIVLAAARDDEIASWDRDAQHGLFTSLLLQAFFNGTAEGPRVTLGALDAFVAARTNERLAALFPNGGRLQRPELRGKRDLVLLDNAGKLVLDPAARVQATIQCNALKHSSDAKAVGDFLASPLCARGCDAACRTALGEHQRTLEREADECANLARGLEALVKAKQSRVVIEAALKDLPTRCTEARAIALAAIAALSPKGSDPAPKVEAMEPPRPAAGFDPALAVNPGSGKSFRDKLANGADCAHCPEMVVVPAGSFVMGSPPSEITDLVKLAGDQFKSEGPQRTVTIRQRFAVGQFEVTFDEWEACAAAGGCTHRPNDVDWGRGKRPVINVSWEDAQQYVAWLSKATGMRYRLLTEAEWEYAARAKTKSRYSFGDSEGGLGQHAWYFSNAGSKTHPVGEKSANAWGLHDMHGNVWEWVEDCRHGDYTGAPSDGSAWTTGCSDVSRVLRGGGWSFSPLLLRTAFRGTGHPGARDVIIGFRLARTIEVAPEEAPQQAGAAPKGSDPAPKVAAMEPPRPAAGSDPALAVNPGSGKSFKDKLADGRDCAHCPEMVVVPAGSFNMGSMDLEKHEQPVHRATFRKAFAVGNFEVTADEWDACVTAGACEKRPHWQTWGRGRRPMIYVTWDNAKKHAAWLSQVTGRDYRLLTEAEWEYAARANSTTKYYFGDDPRGLGQNAWYFANSGKQTHSVGEKRPNRWGLHDVAGNVWEWVEDCYHSSYIGAPTDGSAWTSGDCRERVKRGGGYDDTYMHWEYRSAARRGWPASLYGAELGFRLARTISPAP